MGKIVSVAATSHTFGNTSGVEQATQRVVEGMAEIGRHIAQSSPDVLVIVASDHLNNFTLDTQIPIAIGIADEYKPLGDMGIPILTYQGNRDFAQGFAQYSADAGFDLVQVENIFPDHGVAFPNSYSNNQGTTTLVPLYLNTVMVPPPSCARAYSLGITLADYVRTARPEDERVSVVGSGGLSHWICLPESGQVNEEWDNYVMQTIIDGRGQELVSLSKAEILAQGGNGGLEIASWVFAAGVSEGRKGRKVYYEPMVSWWTGMGGIIMDDLSTNS
ncbi:hypothetical protein [Pusillimonas sp.]|uniref:DODA-type extradiol aromatic ring-opening family dioxygenase n=1 Tax=Pusillimonas sp. TaxID=3040095 RepID=UPI0037C7F347